MSKAARVRSGAKWVAVKIVMAFLIVSITQILLYCNLIGGSFVENILITLASVLIASLLLWLIKSKTSSVPMGR